MKRSERFQSTMKNYADDHLLKTYENSLVYVERTLQNGKIRRGIVGAIDLEQYSYTPEHEAKSVLQRRQSWSESHQE